MSASFDLDDSFEPLSRAAGGAARPALALTDAEILERCRPVYSDEGMVSIEWEFEEAQRVGGVMHERLRARFLARMFDLSEFMKTLKQKFTKWFNHKHERAGVLWEARFKSVIVEGHWSSLLKVAAYIDLNSVRAAIVNDPKDYRWSGYSEAVAGDRVLRCRVRYFSDGLAVGRETSVESLFAVLRDGFSEGRKTGARRMKGGEWEGLDACRALQVNAVVPGEAGG